MTQTEQAEQAAKEYAQQYYGAYPSRDGFLAGAAYQQEQYKEAIKELLEGLREITNSEWMVTHDWGGDRDSILDKAKQLITKYSTNG